MITALGISRKYGIAINTAYKWAAEGRFGMPIAESESAKFYDDRRVQKYMATLCYDRETKRWVKK